MGRHGFRTGSSPDYTNEDLKSNKVKIRINKQEIKTANRENVRFFINPITGTSYEHLESTREVMTQFRTKVVKFKVASKIMVILTDGDTIFLKDYVHSIYGCEMKRNDKNYIFDDVNNLLSDLPFILEQIIEIDGIVHDYTIFIAFVKRKENWMYRYFGLYENYKTFDEMRWKGFNPNEIITNNLIENNITLNKALNKFRDGKYFIPNCIIKDGFIEYF